MQNTKVGSIIREIRLEKGFTQQQLAEQMNISDKTISKWERGLGCPDISLISELADILEITIESLLEGELPYNKFIEGNMKKSKFSVCPLCGNISFVTGNPEIICCGRKVEYLNAVKADEEDKLIVESIDNELYISSAHPMDKDHYISFVALVKSERCEIIKQYPEWDLQVRLSKRTNGILYWYCNNHGLFYQSV